MPKIHLNALRYIYLSVHSTIFKIFLYNILCNYDLYELSYSNTTKNKFAKIKMKGS